MTPSTKQKVGFLVEINGSSFIASDGSITKSIHLANIFDTKSEARDVERTDPRIRFQPTRVLCVVITNTIEMTGEMSW